MKKLLLAIVLVTTAAFIVRAGADDPYGPTIVDHLSYTSSNANHAAVTLVTPVNDTDYAIHVQGYTPTGSDTTASATLTYTNELSSNITVSMGSIANSTPDRGAYVFIHAKGGTNVQLSVTYNANTSSSNYDIFIVTEKL